MEHVSYGEYVSYNLRTYFSKQPKATVVCCPMCSCPINQKNVRQSKSVEIDIDINERNMPLYQYTILYTCSNCYWWCVRESWDILEYGGEYDYVITGIAKKWNLSDRNIPISILKDYLIKNKKKSNFGVIDSFVFEKLIAECLKYEYRPCEVHHVGARGGKGDEGIDIYLIKDDIEWLIQVKRRIKECSEPVDTIRLLNGVLLRKGKQHGMVITSANSFTRNAKAETAIQTPGAYCVELIDRGDILKMLSKAHEGKEPWQRALDDPDVYYRELPLSEEFASLFVK